MNNIVKDIKNKKICIIGYGLSGKGAAELALYLGAHIFISENNIIDKTDNLIQKVSFEEGGHTSKCYNCDIAIISPGIDANHSFFNEFKKREIPLISEIEFASWFSNATIIGITGSNGKSTTVSLLHEILIKKYKKTYLGGNIGTPFSLNIIKEINNNNSQDTIHILEISSFQLERIYDFKPKIACILNLSNDHLDRYDSIEKYYNAKKNIFKNMDKNCYFLYNRDNRKLYNSNEFNQTNIICFNSKEIFHLNNNVIINKKTNKEILNRNKIELIGEHNIENILSAITIAEIMQIKHTDIQNSIYNFRALPHRMENFLTRDDITFINDSKATNPDSTIRAILCSKKDTILILGGYAKGKINYKEIFNIQFSNIKHIICYGDEGKVIYQQIKEKFKCSYIKDFKEATICAIKLSKSNDRVLLSPACSSFDQFNNFEDRGNTFKTIIRNYF